MTRFGTTFHNNYPACIQAKGKVIARVVVMSTKIAISRDVWTRKHNQLGEKLVYVSNRGIRSMSATNSVFLSATVATPIDSAHSVHNAYRLCAANNELVKIVEMLVLNAHGILFGCLLFVNRISDSLADITGDYGNQPLLDIFLNFHHTHKVQLYIA